MSPAGLFTMMEVPIVGYVLTKGYDPRKLAFCGIVIIASSFWWMASLNLDISEGEIILPRIVQVLGIGMITVPISTVIFRFLPRTESSQAAGIYALMRNEGGSLGIAWVSTMLQRNAQVHQQILGQHITASNGLVQQYLGGLGGAAAGQSRGSALVGDGEPLLRHATSGHASLLHGRVPDALRPDALHAPADLLSEAARRPRSMWNWRRIDAPVLALRNAGCPQPASEQYAWRWVEARLGSVVQISGVLRYFSGCVVSPLRRSPQRHYRKIRHPRPLPGTSSAGWRSFTSKTGTRLRRRPALLQLRLRREGEFPRPLILRPFRARTGATAGRLPSARPTGTAIR